MLYYQPREHERDRIFRYRIVGFSIGCHLAVLLLILFFTGHRAIEVTLDIKKAGAPITFLKDTIPAGGILRCSGSLQKAPMAKKAIVPIKPQAKPAPAVKAKPLASKATAPKKEQKPLTQMVKEAAKPVAPKPVAKKMEQPKKVEPQPVKPEPVVELPKKEEPELAVTPQEQPQDPLAVDLYQDMQVDAAGYEIAQAIGAHYRIPEGFDSQDAITIEFTFDHHGKISYISPRTTESLINYQALKEAIILAFQDTCKIKSQSIKFTVR